MPGPIEGSAVVITGASSGIGRAAAYAFARRGARLALAARRIDALREVAEECERLGAPAAIAVPTDVTDEASVDALARTAVQRFGRVDTWINNAAVAALGTVEQTPVAAVRRVIDTNFFGSLYGARAILPQFRRQGRGVLIQTASVMGKFGQSHMAAYAASKHAIVGLAETLREELAGEPGIDVCTILPAMIDTPIFRQMANYAGREPQPMSPVYDAEEVAAAYVELAESPARERYVGGQGWRLVLARTLAPALYERLMARIVETQYLSDRPAAPRDGNLYEPMPEWARVDGEWQPEGGLGRTAGLVAGTALAALGVGLAAWWLADDRQRDRMRAILPG